MLASYLVFTLHHANEHIDNEVIYFLVLIDFIYRHPRPSPVKKVNSIFSAKTGSGFASSWNKLLGPEIPSVPNRWFAIGRHLG